MTGPARQPPPTEHAAEATRLVEATLTGALSRETVRPLVLGLCGSQGSGKSTLAAALAARLGAEGRRVAVLSLDDLYLSRSERQRLAADVHPLLATRGPPGSHDVELGERVLDALAHRRPVRLPRFSKARDEPLAEQEWPAIDAAVDVVVFEGWCVGARPQTEATLLEPINALERQEDPDGRWRRWINTRLAGDYQRLFGRIDVLLLLAAPSFEAVCGWRQQQERQLRETLVARGESLDRTMTDAQVARFVQHYERLTRHILSEMPARADLVIRLDKTRHPVFASSGAV